MIIRQQEHRKRNETRPKRLKMTLTYLGIMNSGQAGYCQKQERERKLNLSRKSLEESVSQKLCITKHTSLSVSIK